MEAPYYGGGYYAPLEAGTGPLVIRSSGNLLHPKVDHQRLGAYVVTVLLLCLHAASTIISVQLGSDMDVIFFIGHWGLLGLLVPIYIVAMYQLHLRQIDRGHLKKGTVFLTILLPALIGLIVGGIHTKNARFFYGHLKSEDCTGARGFVQKASLQDAYLEAHHAWDKCNKRLVDGNNGEELPQPPILQQCEEWSAILNSSAPDLGYLVRWLRSGQSTAAGGVSAGQRMWEFEYLASAEAHHACAGFCSGGHFLWTQQSLEGRGGVAAACGPAVAMRFKTVERQGVLLLGTSFILLGVSLAGYVAIEPTLERLGYE